MLFREDGSPVGNVGDAYLERFNYIIVHKSGASNKVVDGLSWKARLLMKERVEEIRERSGSFFRDNYRMENTWCMMVTFSHMFFSKFVTRQADLGASCVLLKRICQPGQDYHWLGAAVLLAPAQEVGRSAVCRKGQTQNNGIYLPLSIPTAPLKSQWTLFWNF